MAPDVAVGAVRRLAPVDGIVLDPMCGSGTVLASAISEGRRAIGSDVDPLAVLMSRVATSSYKGRGLGDLATAVVAEARKRSRNLPRWMEEAETKAFVEYWFGADQRQSLSQLARVISARRGATGRALRLALSRIIVTKDSGASLARDVSHSRPHRVRVSSDFDVMNAFERSARRLEILLAARNIKGTARVRQGDSRDLRFIGDQAIDLVLTSPPYLNAIDYLRGHRLSLVWLGYTIPELRAIRSGSVGAERAPDLAVDPSIARLVHRAIESSDLPPRYRSIVYRYAGDLQHLVREVARVLRSEGRVVWVIGNSSFRGAFVDNAFLLRSICREQGFRTTSSHSRNLPGSRRYLPPPAELDSSDLDRRMRSEVVLAMRKTT